MRCPGRAGGGCLTETQALPAPAPRGLWPRSSQVTGGPALHAVPLPAPVRGKMTQGSHQSVPTRKVSSAGQEAPVQQGRKYLHFWVGWRECYMFVVVARRLWLVQGVPGCVPAVLCGAPAVRDDVPPRPEEIRAGAPLTSSPYVLALRELQVVRVVRAALGLCSR